MRQSPVFWISLIWLIAAIGFQTWRRDEVIRYDVSSYYSYLPAIFIYHDPGFQFLKKENRRNIWYQVMPDGRRFQRMTLGMSLLYLPFFLAGHAAALLSGYPADGYSMPYALALVFAGVFYGMAGLWLLRRVLLDFFDPRVTDITLICLALGTNLFFYTTMAGAMSHVYSFCLFATLLFLFLKWHQKPGWQLALLAGAVLGIAVLIRPTNIIMLILPLTYGIVDKKSILERWWLYKKNGHLVAVGALTALLILSLQCLYWKYTLGEWLIYSYEKERFYFGNPHILEGLFSFRKGWLLYTPLMFFAIAGCFWLRKGLKAWAVAIPLYLCVQIYVVCSWWNWWYGGSFGQRPMVEAYAFLAIPLAAAIAKILEMRSYLRKLLSGVVILLIFFNLFQTIQVRLGLLHWDSMSKEAYQAIFLKLDRPAELDSLLVHPKLYNALQGKEEKE